MENDSNKQFRYLYLGDLLTATGVTCYFRVWMVGFDPTTSSL